MTTVERNRLAGMSDTYFENIKCVRPALYKFYTDYGDGDILEGFRKARSDLADLKTKTFWLWLIFKEDKTKRLDDLLKCVLDRFSKPKNAKVIVYKWLTTGLGKHEHKIERKLKILSTIVETHKDILDAYLANEDTK